MLDRVSITGRVFGFALFSAALVSAFVKRVVIPSMCNRPPARTYTMGVNVCIKMIHDLVEDPENAKSDPCETHYYTPLELRTTLFHYRNYSLS